MSTDPADMPIPQDGMPAMDEFGMPVQPQSKALGYVLLAGLVAFAASSVGILVISALYHVPKVIIGVGIPAGVLPAIAANVKADRHIKRLGKGGQRAANFVCAAGFFGALILVSVLDPNASGG
jgi:hypothetical protein